MTSVEAYSEAVLMLSGDELENPGQVFERPTHRRPAPRREFQQHSCGSSNALQGPGDSLRISGDAAGMVSIRGIPRMGYQKLKIENGTPRQFLLERLV